MHSPERGLEIWFLTGSQELYGPEVLEQVAQQSKEVCETLASGLTGTPTHRMDAGAHNLRRHSSGLPRRDRPTTPS